MYILERDDILEALHWLEGQRIQVSVAGQRPVELLVDRVIDTTVSSGILARQGIKIQTADGQSIPLDLPKVLEETPTGFVLDFNDPRPPRAPDRGEIEEEDRRALQTIQAGHVEHVTTTGRQSRHKVTITVLE